MGTEHIKLTASEVSQLWTSYINSSMSKCLFTYFIGIAEDTELRPLIQHGLDLAEAHIQKLTAIFQKEGHPVPHGFHVKEDVNTSAPRLFSDNFILFFIYNMGIPALHFYALSKTLAVRSDIDSYFSECLLELKEYDTKAKSLLLSKGLFIRSPHIVPSEEVNFVKDQNWLDELFGKKRPLSAIEITNIFSNLQKNALGSATMMGYSQVAQSKEVGAFMIRGKEIAFKHMKVFSSLLEEDNLPVPMTWDIGITDSTVAPFSDKMLMFMTTSLTALSIGYYATSMATSMRKDLSLHYLRLSAEIASYAADGATLMIQNGWLEEPPLSADRDQLANQ